MTRRRRKRGRRMMRRRGTRRTFNVGRVLVLNNPLAWGDAEFREEALRGRRHRSSHRECEHPVAVVRAPQDPTQAERVGRAQCVVVVDGDQYVVRARLQRCSARGQGPTSR